MPKSNSNTKIYQTPKLWWMMNAHQLSLVHSLSNAFPVEARWYYDKYMYTV
jgi:hypothetical protein